MIQLKQLYSKVTGSANLLSESKKNHLKHLFEDGTLTFDDMRNIFKSVFTGKVGVSHNVKKIPLSVTYKDGKFAIADDGKSLKEPFSVDKVCSRCKCSGQAKAALTQTMNDFIKTLNELELQDLNSIFANGLNYCNFDIVIPSDLCLKDYGNRCFLLCNKISCYDSTFKNVVEDEDSTKKFADKIKVKGNLVINCNLLSDDCIKKLRGATSPDIALKDLIGELDKMVDGIGYKASVNDYVRERYAKYIVNCAMKNGIDVYHNSDFVNELIARLSHISDHRPNRGDLITYAKRDGIDFRTPQYRELIDYLESAADETNDTIMKPVEHLAMRAGVLLMKCLLGMIAADPRNGCKRHIGDLNSTITALEDESTGLTPDKIKLVRKCMRGLEAYQKSLPEDGLLFMHNGKVCKLCGKLGEISNLMKLMNY